MASSLRLVFSNFVITRRSVAPRLVFSASRFLRIDNRSYTTKPTDNDFYDLSSPKLLWPKISSMSFEMTMHNEGKRDLRMDIDGPEKTDSGLLIWLDSCGLEKKDLRLCAEQDKTGSDAKEEMKNGIMLKEDDEFTSNIMANILANDIIASWRDMTAKRSWPYYDMFFNRSIIGKRFCPAIAMLSPIDSFSMYKSESANYLKIEMDMPGKQNMKLTTQGLRISLNNMRGLKREDVKTFFDYDTLFIEGTTKNDSHYITGIHLPKHIHKRHNMIKREVKYGVLYVVIPCVKRKVIMNN